MCRGGRVGYSVYMQLSFFSRSHFGVAVSWFSHCIGSSSTTTTTRTRTSKAVPHWGFLVSELDGMSDGATRVSETSEESSAASSSLR